jgi:hypothetical protein
MGQFQVLKTGFAQLLFYEPVLNGFKEFIVDTMFKKI